MPALFTTEGAPTHRRLALWQDIVCDVFVQLDCKSDLGTAFHGAITSAQLGAVKCSRRLVEPAARTANAVADRARQRGFRAVRARPQRHGRRRAGRPRDRDRAERVRVLRHHAAL